MVHTAVQAKHLALDVKEAMLAQILDYLKEFSVQLLLDCFHMKAILTVLHALSERNVLS